MPRGQKFVFGSVVSSRAIYALCWFNLAAAFPVMSIEYHYSVQALSLLTASFLLGAGLFQIPAGIFSAEIGASKTALVALAAIGITSALSAVNGEFYYELAMRFLTGVAAAFFFAPAMVVASSAIGQGRSGLAIGIYNGAFNVGAGVVFLLFTPLASFIDWRWPFVITSALTFVALAENFYAFKGLVYSVKADLSKIKNTLSSKDLWILAASMLGVNAAYYVGTQFSVSYAENYLQFSPIYAGIISSLILFGAVIGSPLGGWLSDKMSSRRKFVILSSAAVAFSVAFFVLHNAYVLWLTVFVFGIFFSAAYTNSYAYSTEIRGVGAKYTPLAVALLNGVGMATGSVAAPLFAQAVTFRGYDFAWGVLAVASFLSGPLILWAKEPNPDQAHK